MYTISETISRFEKIGNKWKMTESNTYTINNEQYHNATCAETVRFFRNLGGIERVERSYTFAGYVPVKITSISPARDEKTVREYTFTH